MSHKYTCERCQQGKTCTIKGCQGNCVKVCITCIRPKDLLPRNKVDKGGHNG